MRSPSSPAHQPQALFPVSGQCLFEYWPSLPACVTLTKLHLPVSLSFLIRKIWAVTTPAVPRTRCSLMRGRPCQACFLALQRSRSSHDPALTLFYLPLSQRRKASCPVPHSQLAEEQGLRLASQNDTKDLTPGSSQPALPSPSEATLPVSAVTTALLALPRATV